MDKDLWNKIQDEIKLRVDAEPTLGSFLYSLVLSQKNLVGACLLYTSDAADE